MITFKKDEEGTYAELLSGLNGCRKTKMRIYTGEEFFPAKGRAFKTDKNTLALRPEDGWTTYLVQITSGKYGWSEICGISAQEDIEFERVAYGDYLQLLPEGALITTTWAIVSAKGPIIIDGWTSTTYGEDYDTYKKTGVFFRLFPDGRKEDLTDEEIYEIKQIISYS